LTVGGDPGRAFLLFAPWVTGALVQEYWKAILFQEGHGGTAALTDATRLAIMALALPVTLDHRSDYVIVGAWGLGAIAGFGVGTVKLRARLGRIIEAFMLLRGETLVLGRWLGAREVVYQLATYVTVLILAAVIGSEDLGGLRSAEALFSPFSLIAAAFALPALPALSRELTSSRDAAQRLTIRISVVAALLGVAYFIVMVWIGGWLLVHLFGSSFSSFRGLIWPMAVAQLFYVGSFAFTALLIVEKRGAELFVAGAVGAAATVGLTTALASSYGVTGAAWGLAAAAGAASVLVVALGFRTEKWGPRARTKRRDRSQNGWPL
jgi:O-antigen/teichoic acid export membrane protein